MVLFLLIALISSVPQGIIAIFVFAKNHKQATNVLFSAISFTLIAWSLLTLVVNQYPGADGALMLIRATMMLVVIQNTLFYFFCKVFPSSSLKFSSKDIIYLAGSTVMAALTMTPLLFSELEVIDNVANPVPSVAMPLFILHAIVSITVGFRRLNSTGRTASAKLRSQVKIIRVAAIVLWVLVPITNLVATLVFQTTEFTVYTPVYSLVFSSLIAYAIIKQKLFDIRLVVTRSIAYALLLTTLSAIYAVSIFGASSLFLDGGSYSDSEQALNIAAAILLAFTFQPLKRFFDRITDSIFYRDAYNSEAVIRQVNDVVLSSLALDGLLFGISRTLKEELRLQFVVAQIKSVENVSRTTVSTNDIKLGKADMNLVHQSLGDFEKRIITTDELGSGKLKNTLRKYDIDLIARIVTDSDSGDDGLGFIALGPKRSGSLYTNKDITLLDLIASELVVAVQNSLRFEEISQFNEQLTARVDSATSELRDKNKKLKKLDHAKDDFISMASHQLRTPLTTIKGYLSMLSDGDLGKLDKKQQQVVESAFASSERMVYLISDLLNASRINTGKFVIDKKPVKLKSVIENEIKQLGLTAEARDIKLTAELDDKDPVLNLDANKLKQVIMNFIDNAIYYSEQGSEIIVDYQVTADAVELRVIDSGIGVPKEAQSNLFTKFYRAENAKRVRPDGTGLGLFLAKKVVTAQGGSIIFESEIGKGSTFGFRFALSAVATNEEPTN